MPIMDIEVLVISLDDNVRVSIEEFAQKCGVLPDWLELLNSVDLDAFLSALGKESLCFCLELSNMHF